MATKIAKSDCCVKMCLQNAFLYNVIEFAKGCLEVIEEMSKKDKRLFEAKKSTMH